jgi:alpha-tubulin suppressor-like RCC1 family protein
MPVESPTRLYIEGKVSSVALGARHTVCALDSGKLLSFGENRFGQCGIEPSTVSPITLEQPGKKTKKVSDVIITPMRVNLPSDERPGTLVKSGWNFTLVWQPSSPGNSAPGNVWLFGRNNYGQLGRGSASAFEWSPQQPALPSDFQLVQVECGSEHTLLLSPNGSVWAFGWNEHGQLGLGDEHDRHEPTLIPSLNDKLIDRIACGYGFSFALSKE